MPVAAQRQSAKTRSPWQSISIQPLIGPLDTRSRPSDLPPGAFRWKEWTQATSEGKLCRRAGFIKAFDIYEYDVNGLLWSDPNHDTTSQKYAHNHDHHHQGDTREPIVFMYEATDQDGKRYLYDGTQSRLSTLRESDGSWFNLASGKGSFASRWKAAGLEGKILFTNNVDDVLIADIGDNAPAGTIPELIGRNVRAAKTIAEFSGFILLMNVIQDGKRQSARIVWCDLSDPTSWDLSKVDTLAGFQDLDYGDEILAAMPLLGSLYIYTRRSIWKCTVAAQQNQTFSFVRVYNEPKNQTGCLVYENTLTSTGDRHYFMSRDGIYYYSPYVAQPERDDWVHRASGAIFKRVDTKMTSLVCGAAVGEYTPATKELWFSWPSTGKVYNDLSMVFSLDNKTADVVRAGFTSFVNYRENPAFDGTCSEDQTFLAASGHDFCIKEMGVNFSLTYANTADDVTADLPENIPLTTGYEIVGYNSIIRGIIPTGLNDREKIIRQALIDADVSEQEKPCLVKCRIGHSFKLVDPNDADDICAPMWVEVGSKPLACSDSLKISQMRAKNMRPSDNITFPCYIQNTFLYFEFTVVNFDGGLAIGGDACFERTDFDCLAMPKP